MTTEEKFTTDYGITLLNYIHQNPLKSGLVQKMEDWTYSSFPDYINLRQGLLCDKEFTIKFLGLPVNLSDFYSLSYNTINRDIIEKIL